MTGTPCILAIDQGTTSSRAILFDGEGTIQALAQREFRQHYPQAGWVEHDPEEIWDTVVAVCREVLDKAQADDLNVIAIGITNQRETTLVWDRETGKPVHNAIVWQDRRTADFCRRLREAGHEAMVTDRTGLVLDPYFSATKITWLLDNVRGVRARAEAGKLAFGTVDSFLLWRLTGGRVHATDATNACRTCLFNIERQDWDADLLSLFDIPVSLMPEVRDSAADFGHTDKAVLGTPIPVCGVAGDQQAALIGQACFKPGMVKSTFGTGCFVVLNTGETIVRSRNKLLTTVAYRLNGKAYYALEGSIFAAGTTVQWLRDGLGLIQSATETEALASSIENNNGVYIVPAFAGLGAPWWDAEARGAIYGLTRGSGKAEMVRAALESTVYQLSDLVGAMVADGGTIEAMRVDGGMVANGWMMQFLADILDLRTDRPVIAETTAFGAACLAGLQAGLYGSLDDLATRWQLDRSFEPAMTVQTRARNLAGWRDAVSRTLTER
ncbi:glycerol kinase GlpK [Aquisalinus flavus]|uniref:Glycerol kinase n=1 Tax=Aquisalinus flavus TaxID=1526572 RepID=A0A8J2V1R8_9PROT|nr:glycerol kinase GlpK [Aquisalinus flavus]MBD0426056.1 glycerol kinase GlpK [Aquisalinus flavus]UNE48357.1 glycerol kinase GlpK [Aquisalinus flavus]GGD11057.1 glycerol kinase 1 [Aquisalinus flavus]